MSKLKFILFSLLPAVLLLFIAEVTIRSVGLDRPTLHSDQLETESIGLTQPDYELFWSLRPKADKHYVAPVTTNSLGLRSPEIVPKKDNEFRILSLGESTTFGVGVGDSETYSALLPALLKETIRSYSFTSINAGVPAYSSFQSLKYLELRGLNLKPDLILFYHELNDYLPSSLRDSSNTEIDVSKTDKQLYDSRVQSINRFLMSSSALFRFLNYRISYMRLRSLNRGNFVVPLSNLGLPNIVLAPRLVKIHNEQVSDANLNEISLGQRVSEKERLENLEQLVSLCKSRNIYLIIIHPTYRDSLPHECLLTRFCKEKNLLMFESYNTLHPQNLPYNALYLEALHPNKQGHLNLARDLASFIAERIFSHPNASPAKDH